jgi:hypothetical protein
VDGEEKPTSFKLIKKTSKQSRDIVSAYKDNVAFVRSESHTTKVLTNLILRRKEFESVLSLKAETHNSQQQLSLSELQLDPEVKFGPIGWWTRFITISRNSGLHDFLFEIDQQS